MIKTRYRTLFWIISGIWGVLSALAEAKMTVSDLKPDLIERMFLSGNQLLVGEILGVLEENPQLKDAKLERAVLASLAAVYPISLAQPLTMEEFARLDSRFGDHRARAIVWLAQRRDAGDSAFLPILEAALLRDTSVPARTEAAKALGSIGTPTPYVLASLERAMREDFNPEVKSAAAMGLGKAAAKSDPKTRTATIASLMRAAEEGRGAEEGAVRALESFGAGDATARAALHTVLADGQKRFATHTKAAALDAVASSMADRDLIKAIRVLASQSHDPVLREKATLVLRLPRCRGLLRGMGEP